MSDQAKALIAHAETHLGLHHSPDLFHVQYETSQATSLALNRQTEKAQNELTTAEAACKENASLLSVFTEICPSSLQQLDLEKKLRSESIALEEVATQTRERFEQVQARQRLAQEARCGLSKDFHPFDLQTGDAIQANRAEERLEKHFETLAKIAVDAKLSSSSRARIAKARRVLPSMIATIAFFWSMIASEHIPTVEFLRRRSQWPTVVAPSRSSGINCEQATCIAGTAQLCGEAIRWHDGGRTILWPATSGSLWVAR